jgi:hypothetical protein
LKRDSRDPDDAHVSVTIGSYQNDRAMAATVVYDAPGFDHFDSMRQLAEFVRVQGIDVVDEFEGSIY